MFFFSKKKEIVLDCFTSLPHAYEYAKIDHAVKHIPEWWKDTPRLISNRPSIKNCEGIKDYYRTGIVIPSWFETDFRISSKDGPNDYAWEWNASCPMFNTSGSHDSREFLGFAKSTGKNIKIKSPWLIRTKESVEFVWSQPTWNLREHLWNFCVLPAVLNFKYTHGAVINLFVENSDEEKIWTRPPQMPLVIMHPMTERKVKIQHHLVTDREIRQLGSADNLMLRDKLQNQINWYRNKKKIIDKSCPYNNDDTNR
jgi:hypothetical protein